MGTPTKQSIELSIRIAAPRELVFQFFSDPQRYKLWMGQHSTMNPGPGGQLTVSFGPGPTALGKILEWRPPEKIVFDWSHEGRPGSSRVTIELSSDGAATIVTLRHEGITEAPEREGTAAGWRYYLSALGNAAIAERVDTVAPGRIEQYLSAWSQVDPSNRLATLEDCVAETVKFRDRYGAVEGRQGLSEYIGGVQKMMGPAPIKAEGPIDRVQGFLRQNWLIPGPDGKPLFRGQNFYEMDAEARLTMIVGFWA